MRGFEEGGNAGFEHDEPGRASRKACSVTRQAERTGSVRPTRHERDAREGAEGGPDDGRRRRTSGRISTRTSKQRNGHTDGCAWSEVSNGERGYSTAEEASPEEAKAVLFRTDGFGWGTSELMHAKSTERRE